MVWFLLLIGAGLFLHFFIKGLNRPKPPLFNEGHQYRQRNPEEVLEDARQRLDSLEEAIRLNASSSKE